MLLLWTYSVCNKLSYDIFDFFIVASVIQLIALCFYFCFVIPFSTPMHEIGHARKAEELYPDLKTVVHLFSLRFRTKKVVDGPRTTYHIPFFKKTKEMNVSRFQIENDFADFSDEAMVATALGGLNATKKWLWITSLIAFVLGIWEYFFFVIITLIHCKIKESKATNRKEWNDYSAVLYPAEYRQYRLNSEEKATTGYEAMVAFGESCLTN